MCTKLINVDMTRKKKKILHGALHTHREVRDTSHVFFFFSHDFYFLILNRIFSTWVRFIWLKYRARSKRPNCVVRMTWCDFSLVCLSITLFYLTFFSFICLVNGAGYQNKWCPVNMKNDGICFSRRSFFYRCYYLFIAEYIFHTFLFSIFTHKLSRFCRHVLLLLHLINFFIRPTITLIYFSSIDTHIRRKKIRQKLK